MELVKKESKAVMRSLSREGDYFADCALLSFLTIKPSLIQITNSK
jgi:hypothetical protein